MIFATLLLSLCLLPQTRSVKVVIDGTIDFGPNWNVKYRINPVNNAEPRKRIPSYPSIQMNSEDHGTKVREGNNEAITTEIIEDSTEIDVKDHAESIDEDGSLNYVINDERDVGVTKLYEYKAASHPETMLRSPRKVKNDHQLIKFIKHLNRESLKMFDNLREKFNDKGIETKFSELSDRYKNKFGEFINETMHHTIRTTFGNKKVVLNAINYSNSVLNRLLNRFKIDFDENGLSNPKISKNFKEDIDNLKIKAYEEACRTFSICRAGNEFCDHISDMINNLLERDDTKVQLAVKAIVKQLKSADLRKIMDEETLKAFRNGLESLEELSPFELRVVLMAYKIIIENRHEPFENKESNGNLIKVIVAMYDVLEGFNKKIIIDTQDWNTVEKKFNSWLSTGEGDETDIAKELVDRFKEKIDDLDKKTANDFKSKLRICLLAKKT